MGYLWLCTLQAGLAFQTQEKVAIGLDGFFSAAIFTGLKTIKQESKLEFSFSGISFQQFFCRNFLSASLFFRHFLSEISTSWKDEESPKSYNKFFFRQFLFQVF